MRLQLNLYPSASFCYKRKIKKIFKKVKKGFFLEICNFLKLLWGRGWLQLNEKKPMESQTRLMSWYWKRKPTWRKDLITYNSNPRIIFPFNWPVIIRRRGGGRVSLKLDVQGQGSGRIMDVAAQGSGRSCKLGNFHRRPMCIVPNVTVMV